MPAIRTSTLLGVAAVLFLVTTAAPARCEAPSPTPVFIVPLKTTEAFRKYERTLRQTLTAQLLATGKFVAAVSAETDKTMQECIRSVNQDANAEQCWVRIGVGQGADMMVAGEIRGHEASCDLSVQLTVLETRVSSRMHVQMLEPCGKKQLFAEMGRAAQVLAGRAPVAAAPGVVAPSAGQATLPPPPAASTTPAAIGVAPPPPAQAVGSLSVTGTPKGARIDVEGPPRFNGGKALATSLPLFPPQTIPAGEYAVRVSAPGYETRSEKRLVRALGTWALEVALVKSTATLLLSGTPAGAETTVRCGPGFAEKPANVAEEPFGLPAKPLEFSVAKGTCRVRASLVGWETFEQEVTLAGGERKALRVSLTKTSSPGREVRPVARWTFEECMDTLDVVLDLSGNRLHGTNHGAGCGEGRKGVSLGFDGKDDRAEIPDRPALHFTKAMTVAAWVKPDNGDGTQTILSKWYALDSYMLMIEKGTFKFVVAFPDPGSKWGKAVGVASVMPAKRWVHVAGVYDGSHLYLYVDGAPTMKRKVSGTLQQSDRPVVIGNHPKWNAYGGFIDEVYLYDVALTAEEVRELAGL